MRVQRRSPRRTRARKAWKSAAAIAALPATLLTGLVLFGSACSESKLAGLGGECFQATDCEDGLVCAPSRGGRRTCTNDLAGIQKTDQLGDREDGAAASDGATDDAPSVTDGPADRTTPKDVNSPPDTSVPDTAPPPDTGAG